MFPRRREAESRANTGTEVFVSSEFWRNPSGNSPIATPARMKTAAWWKPCPFPGAGPAPLPWIVSLRLWDCHLAKPCSMEAMTTPAFSDLHRHVISDAIRAEIEPILPGRPGVWGGIAKDNRRFVNAVCRVSGRERPGATSRPNAADGAPPPVFHPLEGRRGPETFAGSMPRRAGHGMAHGGRQPRQGTPARGGSRRRNRGNRPCKRGRNTKMHLACDSNGLPVRVPVTAGTVADCTQALPLIEGLEGEALPADRAYDTDAIVDAAGEAGWKLPFRQDATAKGNADTTNTSANRGIRSKTLSCG